MLFVNNCKKINSRNPFFQDPANAHGYDSDSENIKGQTSSDDLVNQDCESSIKNMELGASDPLKAELLRQMLSTKDLLEKKQKHKNLGVRKLFDTINIKLCKIIYFEILNLYHIYLCIDIKSLSVI